MRSMKVAAALAGALAAIAVGAAPASANMSQDGNLDCQSSGNYHFICDLVPAYPHTPNSEVWYLGTTHLNFDGQATIMTTCPPNTSVRVKVNWKDETGTAYTSAVGFNCTLYAP